MDIRTQSMKLTGQRKAQRRWPHLHPQQRPWMHWAFLQTWSAKFIKKLVPSTEDLGEPTLVGTRRNCHFCISINASTHPGRIHCSQSISQPWQPTSRSVLITLDFPKSFYGCIYYKLRGWIPKKSLSHIYNGLVWRGCSSRIYNWPK